MKIKSKDLDNDLLKKIERLDKIDKYKDGGLNCLILDKDNNIKTDILNLNPLYKILEKKDIEFTKNFGESSIYNNINDHNISSQYFQSQIVLPIGIRNISLIGNIVKTKIFKDKLFIITDKGIISLINMTSDKIVFTVNILKEIKKTFNLIDIYPHEISDVTFSEKGFIISLLNHGVFEFDLDESTAEFKISDKNITSVSVIDKYLICFYDREINNIVIYNLDSNKKIESFNNLKRSGYQIPNKVVYNNKYLFVLGKSINRNLYSCLHGFSINKEINNIDFEIYPLPLDIEFNDIQLVDDDLYLISDNSVYKYDINRLSDKYKIYDISNCKLIDKDYYICKENSRIVKYDIIDNTILYNLDTLLDYKDLFIYNNIVNVIIDNNISQFKLPSYNLDSSVDFNIQLDDDNVVDIYIKSKNIKEDKIDIDVDCIKYFIKDKEGLFIRLLNIPNNIKNIKLRFKKIDSRIDDIRINKNKYYYSGDK